ncbi:MAG: molybdopterin converting factor subunit 1 [Parvibaculaceae bacterium]
MTKILYFARLKQIVGRGEDEIDIPASVKTVSGLIEFLKGRDEGAAHAFSDLRVVRAAVDQSHVQLDAPIAGAREIAFFPPVTGG